MCRFQLGSNYRSSADAPVHVLRYREAMLKRENGNDTFFTICLVIAVTPGLPCNYFERLLALPYLHHVALPYLYIMLLCASAGRVLRLLPQRGLTQLLYAGSTKSIKTICYDTGFLQ